VTEPITDGAPVDSSVLVDRRAQRKRRLRRTIAVIVVLIGIFTIWLVWFSPVLSVQRVEVVGVEGAAATEVLELADVPLGVPIARLDTSAPLQRVLTLQWLAAAEVRRGWPSQVVIAVEPRTAVARTKVDGQWLGVDSQGVAFTPPAPLGKGLIEVSGIGVALRAGVEVLDSLPADLLGRVSSVSATTRDDVELTLNSGSLVRWGSADEADFKSQVLTALLARRAQVYDVSAPELPTTFNERPKKP
jgi:cell division protein FtsQ